MNRRTERQKRSGPPQVPSPDPGTPLEPGERTILWAFAEFATGIAPPVKGRRWFRDPEGHDIEPLLEQRAGWPHREGPTGPPAGDAPQWRDRTGKAVRTGLGVAGKALEIGGALAGGLSGDTDWVAGTPETRYMDPAIEASDFPVMVAAPASAASSAPWLLDPARRPAEWKTVLSLTSLRLLATAVASPGGRLPLTDLLGSAPRELIWQIPRRRIAGARQRKYSVNEQDVIIGFTDGSWIRVHLNAQAEDLAGILGAQQHE